MSGISKQEVETIKQIGGYEGLYGVDECGNVYSYTRKIFLHQSIHKCGYKKVRLSKFGIAKDYYVHRLVAKAFVPNPKNLNEVNHINGDKKDNRVSNLEWVSHKENIEHSYLNGLQKRKISKRKGLSTEEVISIRELYDNGISTYRISEIFGCCVSHVRNIGKRKKRKNVA